ncbi:MAG: hypothetical protein WCL32_24935 [Planctomycetota bacterium]
MTMNSKSDIKPGDWVCHFRSVPGFGNHASRRMAMLLKSALRCHGFRLVQLLPDIPGEHPPPAPGLDVERDEPPFA